MTKVIPNPKQFLLGFFITFMGLLIYITFRPPWQAVWITKFVSFDLLNFLFLTKIGNNLPSFLHVIGFSLLTSGLVAQKKRNYAIVCGSWLFINILFEFLQADLICKLLNDISYHHNIINPLLQWLKNYSLHTVFDPLDIIAILTGGITAYFILIKTKPEN